MQEIAAYAIGGNSPQYVATLGALYCDFTAPCLAFRQGNDAYVFFKPGQSGNTLFKIASEEPRLVLQPGERLDSGLARGVLPTLPTDGTARLIPLGARTWTIAREVTGPSVLARRR
ncbi:MAG TPA: hypothetical protein VMW75_10040 [Thermoanaerobaculia bacterium]|nr:hypothetical protein [Thermoanaerobaculia bacterium]